MPSTNVSPCGVIFGIAQLSDSPQQQQQQQQRQYQHPSSHGAHCASAGRAFDNNEENACSLLPKIREAAPLSHMWAGPSDWSPLPPPPAHPSAMLSSAMLPTGGGPFDDSLVKQGEEEGGGDASGAPANHLLLLSSTAPPPPLLVDNGGDKSVPAVAGINSAEQPFDFPSSLAIEDVDAGMCCFGAWA